MHRYLPRNYFSFFVAGIPFFYYSGIFYQRHNDGYVVVEAPIGARIEVLPDECSSLYVNGQLYYTCNDVFYRPVDNYYVVCQRPTQFRVIAEIGDEVQVTIESLNVRSGPGEEYGVVSLLYKDDVVEVTDKQGDWYYIRLPDNNYGWVMSQYTDIYNIGSNSQG